MDAAPDQHRPTVAAGAGYLTAGVAVLRPDPTTTARPAAASPHRRTNDFRPEATNEWDRMPAEVQRMVLATAGPFTLFVNGLLLAAELRGMPQKQREQVWQDANDADWQGDFTLLPPVDIDSKSLRLRRSFFVRGCFSTGHTARVALRNGWTDLVDDAKPIDLARAAISEGDLELLRDLIDVRKFVTPSSLLLQYAASHGSLEAVEFLHRRMDPGACTFDIGRDAARSGNLDLVVWLSKHIPERLGRSAFEYSAWGNHMHIVSWLAENTGIPCDKHAIAHAARNGNVEMLTFLSERFPEAIGDSGHGFVSSDMRALEWLDERGLVDGSKLAGHISQTGRIDVLEWALSHFQLDLN
ncbi:hypothetical protein HK105_208403 [Polyrhizophydium stewartii]|uniref:Ankyrin repeat domain-containing protein n=1 Tax=Polyrhizophydium stewartii TaxID=2732419 RepID=A0ABR4MXY8_9FUNG